MANTKNDQTLLFRGIYEFEDPSGTLLATKVPYVGSADLYNGTIVIVRPNQHVIFVHKGNIADDLGPGTHSLSSENIPVLTRLLNVKLGLKSPIRSELWFFSRQIMTGRRWGTSAPVLWVPKAKSSAIPVRAFGQFSLRLRDPIQFYSSLVGSRASFDITDLEAFVQGQILEVLPVALGHVEDIKTLSTRQDDVSKLIESLLREKLGPTGVDVLDLQVISVSPGSEYLKALETKAAMDEIGDPKALLLYQAAQSLRDDSNASDDNKQNPLNTLMSLMLGKYILQNRPEASPFDETAQAKPALAGSAKAPKYCGKCGAGAATSEQRFCGSCGGKL